jgi:hypothetical protein
MTTNMMTTTTSTQQHVPHPMTMDANTIKRLLVQLLALTLAAPFNDYLTVVYAQSNVTIDTGLPPVFFLNVPSGATLTCSPSGNVYTFRSAVGRTPILANTTTNANGTALVDEIVWGPCSGGDDDATTADSEEDNGGDCTVIVPLECTTCITANQQPCPSPVQQGSTSCTITSRNGEGKAVNISEDFDGGFDPLCSNFMGQL